jgi:hypothetical protein
MMMFSDPVVQEMRRNGARIAEACGGDVHRMAEHLRRAQSKSAQRVVRRVGKSATPRSPHPDRGM